MGGNASRCDAEDWRETAKRYFVIRTSRMFQNNFSSRCRFTIETKLLSRERSRVVLEIRRRVRKAVRTLFKRSKRWPSIIFIDEIDGLASSRGGGETKSEGSSVYDRVVTQLLLEMDGLNSSSRAEKIAVIAATNPRFIDEALLRPGRFDRLLFVKAPETSKERGKSSRALFVKRR